MTLSISVDPENTNKNDSMITNINSLFNFNSPKINNDVENNDVENNKFKNVKDSIELINSDKSSLGFSF